MQTVTDQSIPAAFRREIDARLTAVAAAHDVRILMAVESGSRAWGFPSPDSDYDVRFVYVRPRDRYLSLTPPRDVIEMPIEDEIDLNGWDVRKALGLMLRSNAVVGEWIASPIRYRHDDPVVARIAALGDRLLDARALAHHYASLGRHAAERWLVDGGAVAVKRYFYALRPALAIRCLRLHPDRRPPMALQALVEASALPEPIRAAIAALVETKARTHERRNAARLPALDALIADELSRAVDIPARAAAGPGFTDEADAIFLEAVQS